MATPVDVSSESDLVTAIGNANTASQANPGASLAPIVLEKNIALGSALPAIDLGAGSSLTIESASGDNFSIDGGGSVRGLVVDGGDVTLNSLSLHDDVTTGAAGTGGGGGGAGLGGGLFVGSGATVTLDDVLFSHDKAAGGAGGASGGASGTAGGAGGQGGGGGKGGGFSAAPGTLGRGGNGGRTGANVHSSGSGFSGGFGGGGGGGGGGRGGHGGKDGFTKSHTTYKTRVHYSTVVSVTPGGHKVLNSGTRTETLTRTYPLGGTRPGGPGALGGAGALGGFGAGAGGAGGSGASGVAGVPLSPFPGENTKAPGGHGGAAGGGGGGLGAGGDIFVQSGGQLLIEGGSLSGGGATGGQGGDGANLGGMGQGYGSGIFLQGTSAIVFDPSASQSVVVDDVIADINGSNNAFLGALTLQMNGAGVLELGAANTFTGGVELDDGTLKLDVATAAGSTAGLIAFDAAAGRTATLELEPAAQNPGGVFNNELESFGADDRIDLVGLTYTGSSSSTAINLGGGSHLIVSEDGQTESFKLQNPAQQTYYAFSDGAGGTFVAGSPPCYAKGTRILVDRGEIPVEALAIGDFVVTASGARRPIAWIGHRRIDVSRHPDPAAVRPVRVCANAFGEGLPRRDLWLSPGHNVASEGALMPISALVNGLSVAQIEADRVEYWHVELDAHDILLAEGLPAESYLDCGNRTAFENGGAYVEAHPDFAPRGWVDACLPLMTEGPAVAATKARLLARLAERGLSVDREADAHVVIDGLRIEPLRLSQERLAFVLPAAGREIALQSKTFIPAHTLAASIDSRELGICVARLRIDGAAVALDCDQTCATGWREAEFADGRFARRWTRGAAPLPAGARVVIVDLAGFGHYWRIPVGDVSALFA